MLTQWLVNLRRNLTKRRMERCRNLANKAKDRGDMEAYRAWRFAYLVLKYKYDLEAA